MIRFRVFGHREFGLIDRFVRQQVENLGHAIFLPKRSSPGRLNRGYPAADEAAEDTTAARTDAAVPSRETRKAA
jgi:hypothetical protein